MIRALFKTVSKAIFGAVIFTNAALISLPVRAAGIDALAAEIARQTAFKESLLRELDQAGIGPPAVFDPFPTGFVEPQFHIRPTTVIGLSPFSQTYNNLKVNIDPSCQNNYFVKHFEQMQRMAADHEVTHFVDMKLGLTAQLFEQNLPAMEIFHHALPREQNILRASVMENVADASAILKAQSYGGGASEVVGWSDFRLVALGMQLDYHTKGYVHNTSKTLLAAAKAFSAHPRQDLTIVEAARWAIDIVTAQAADFAFADQMKIAMAYRLAIDEAIRTGAQIIEPLYENEQQRDILESYLRDAAAAKARFCADDYTMTAPSHRIDPAGLTFRQANPKNHAGLQ